MASRGSTRTICRTGDTEALRLTVAMDPVPGPDLVSARPAETVVPGLRVAIAGRETVRGRRASKVLVVNDLQDPKCLAQ